MKSTGAALSAIALLGAVTSVAAASETADDLAHIRQIEQSLTPQVQIVGRPAAPRTLVELMRDKQVPAVSIAFVDNGRVEWVRAYGLADIAAGRPTTAATLFQAGSISKPVAATAVMAMVQDGELTLDQPVNERLVSWKIPNNAFTAKTPVTLRMLLTHTGGLTVHGFEGYEAGAPVPSVVQVLDGTPPANSDPIRVDIAPGTKWRYSGGGYTIAQLLVSDVARKPFPEVVKARVLAPLGMDASTYEQPLPPARLGEAAVGYRANGVPIAGLRNTYPEMAAAGLWTNPSDLARWVIGLQDALAGRSQAVLTKATATAMLTPGLGDWGLGLMVKGEGRDLVFSHGGANEGFRNDMYGFPGRRQGVVIMSNSDVGSKVTRPLLHAIAASYGWPGFETKQITPAPVKPGELKAFAGHYLLGTSVSTVRERPDGRSLELVPPVGESYELIPQGGDAFLDADSAAPETFIRDGSGKLTGLDFFGQKLVRAADQ